MAAAVGKPRFRPDIQDNAPAVRLREYLTDARLSGKPFFTAWQYGRIRALRGIAGRERREWTVALDETQDAWRRAYAGVNPLPGFRALADLTDDDDHSTFVAGTRALPPDD